MPRSADICLPIEQWIPGRRYNARTNDSWPWGTRGNNMKKQPLAAQLTVGNLTFYHAARGMGTERLSVGGPGRRHPVTLHH